MSKSLEEQIEEQKRILESNKKATKQKQELSELKIKNLQSKPMVSIVWRILGGLVIILKPIFGMLGTASKNFAENAKESTKNRGGPF